MGIFSRKYSTAKISDYTVCTLLYYTGPPALSVNIIKNTENSSIVVQWDAVDDFLPTTYTVTWFDTRDLYGVATVDEQTSYTITGLTLDTIYIILVDAINRCGDGPRFVTRITISTVTTSTTSTISPTVTASTTPIISAANPSSTTTTTAVTSSSAINTATITTLRTTTVTTVINSSIVIPTGITYPSITTTTNIADPPIPTDTSTGGETSKFSNK